MPLPSAETLSRKVEPSFPRDHRVGGGSRLPPPPTERSVQISCTTLFGRGFTALLVCYSFESCFHGRRFISLHRWPYPPLHGGHVAFEQFNARWPLPHVAGSPDLGVLSASLTAVGPSDRSRRFGLAGPTSFLLSPTALPCSHETFGQHAGGTNPGSISRRSPWHVMKLGLPLCGIGSATSTTIDFGAKETLKNSTPPILDRENSIAWPFLQLHFRLFSVCP